MGRRVVHVTSVFGHAVFRLFMLDAKIGLDVLTREGYAEIWLPLSSWSQCATSYGFRRGPEK